MDNDLISLLRKFVGNQCSTKELRQIDALMKKGISSEVWLKVLDKTEPDYTETPLTQQEVERIFNKVQNRIGTDQRGKQVFLSNGKWVTGLAASVIIFVVAFIGFINRPQQTALPWITSVALEQERRHVLIPDGSEIWINNRSSLRYPEQFDSGMRNVALEGEAFFNVAHDAERPFVVSTQQIAIHVLGTSFNVRSYSDDDEIVITLATGKVEIKLDGRREVLTPGEQLRYNKRTQTFARFQVDPRNQYAWKDGWLVFNSTPLGQIAKRIERAYGMKVLFEDNNLRLIRISLKHKEKNLHNLLDVLAFSAGAAYELKGDTIIMKSKIK